MPASSPAADAVVASPFLDEFRFLDEASVAARAHARTVASMTPFVSAYQLEDSLETFNPDEAEFAYFLAELRDEEFQDALLEVANEFRASRSNEYQREASDVSGDARFIDSYLAPALHEVDRFFETTLGRFGETAPEELMDEEIDAEFDRYETAGDLSPAFENLFGFVKKIAKKALSTAAKVARAGVKAAASLGLAPLLRKLWKFVPRLLKYWLQKVIHHVPPALMPAARQLAGKYLGSGWNLPLPAKAGRAPVQGAPVRSSAHTSGAVADPGAAAPDGSASTASMSSGATSPVAPEQPAPAASQPADAAPVVAEELLSEFEFRVAEAVFADEEADFENVDFIPPTQEESSPDPLEELDLAREEFTRQISTMRSGDDPTPHVEAFLPAVLPLAAKLVGKNRLRRLIAPVVAKLIRNFTGQQNATALAKFLVDKGLRLVNLEASPEDDVREAAGAVTRTVEEAVLRVAELPDDILNNEALLEGFVLEAFEQAAAANLPVLTEEAYAKHPNLRETDLSEGFWTWQPTTGRRWYNKFTRTFDVTITPHLADAVLSFNHLPLSAFFADHLAIPRGRRVKCRLHLYEALPGTTLPMISRLERHVPGLGAAPWGHVQFHPLTPAAAGLLLGQPRLGRALAPPFLADRNRVAIGGRYYYPEISGARLKQFPRSRGRSALRRSSQVRIRLDFVARQITVYVFLSEAEAQELARRLRGREGAAAMSLTALRPLIDGGVRYALTGDARGRVKILHSAPDPLLTRGDTLKRLSRAAHDQLSSILASHTLHSIAGLMQQDPTSFFTRTEDDADGVTFVVRLSLPHVLTPLANVLTGKAPAGGALFNPTPSSPASATVVAGFHRE